MQNNEFNLKNQYIQEQKSLWRIKEFYLNDCQTDEEKAFWEELAKQKEETIAHIHKLIG